MNYFDPKSRRNIADLIIKEKNVVISSLPHRPELSVQDHRQESRDIVEQVKKQIEMGINNNKSIVIAVIRR